MKIAPITRLILPLVPAVLPVSAMAEGTRSLDAHEHGSGVLNIAFEGNTIAMEVEAPGADIVGFEHAASSDEHRALIEAAVSDLARPLDLFVLNGAAGCSVVSASVELHGDEGDDHADHDDDHAKEDGHDDHDGHAHEAEEGHDDEHHDGHADHDDEKGAEHSEFHAEYELKCSDPSAVDKIEFAYFDRFPNALELQVQIVSDKGAQAHEVERDEPVLDLQGMF